MLSKSRKSNQSGAFLYRPRCGWHSFGASGRNRLGSSIKEAKRAQIPVVLIDRGVAKRIPVCNLTKIASDFKKRALLAASWLAAKNQRAL